MIAVSTHDELAGVRLVVSGHSREEFGDYERTAVCAAVGILLATLIEDVDGSLDAGAPGHIDQFIPAEHLDVGGFVARGLATLAIYYPGHFTIDQQDTRLRRRAS